MQCIALMRPLKRRWINFSYKITIMLSKASDGYFFDLLLIESTKCMMDTVNELNPIIIISASAMLIIKASPF